MRGSVIQLHPIQGDLSANLRRAEQLLARAAESRPDLVVLPELFATGLPDRHESPTDLAQGPDGSIPTWLVDRAAQHHLMLAGTFLEAEGSVVRNRLLVAEADGRVHRYAKMNLDRLERQVLSPGQDPSVVDTGLGPVGLAVCFDAADPALVDKLHGVGLVVFPHATLATRWAARLVWAYESHRRPLMGSFAEKVSAYVLAAGQVGPCSIRQRSAGNYMRGSTFVIGPSGRAMDSVGFGEDGIATFEW